MGKNILWYGHNFLKYPVSPRNIQQVSQILDCLDNTSFQHLSKQCCVVDISMLMFEGINAPKFAHVNIALREEERSGE